MKKMKWIASLVLALVLMMGIATTASAAGSYTVTVSGGLYNTQTLEFKSDGKTAVTIPNMTPNNDKYYFKGYTLAGRDLPAGTAGHSQAFIPDKDIELVAHYGMKGSMVSYTINFVEYGTTNKVHDPETYYGNVGDQPVAPYVYVEGFEPQAYNITGTLKEGTNDWTLYYYRIVTPTPAPADEGGGGGGGGGANANANANANVPGGDIVVNPNANAGANAGAQPQDIINVDEQEAPLAGPTGEGEPSASASPDPNTAKGQNEEIRKLGTLFATVGGASALTILLGLLVAFFKRGLFG